MFAAMLSLTANVIGAQVPHAAENLLPASIGPFGAANQDRWRDGPLVGIWCVG
ncbi:hypothetical protein [Streptomyces sp. NBC_01451]|uniref:hypothetical protein n=1 Tax=Streptomyces sp. NBC_01451 TaxID=2903872 RepID=UPI002E315CEF|nr:hypothetical protein [Streptomyces sp. NBC_01451]